MATKLRELIGALDIKALRGVTDEALDSEITGVFNDSRRVIPGSVFVAERGFDTDGHKYIGPAMEKGAIAVVCEEEAPDAPCIVTDDSRRACAILAAEINGRPADGLVLVGVTGTNGKTTVTNLIKHILERATGEKCGLIGTNRNMIGDAELPAERTTPDSLELHALFRQMADAGCKYAVMEVSSHALFLERVYGLNFKAAVFTNLTEDHLDFHKTMDAYAAAKSILFGMADVSVVNADDAYAPMMLAAAKGAAVTYSIKGDADFSAADETLLPDAVEFTVREKRARLNIPGRFSVYNALAAISAVWAVGIELDAVISALAECRGVMGRAEVVPTGRDFTVMIDYAHTPDALENILRTVRGFAKGRTIAVFGCGGDRDREKRPIMGRIAADLADVAVITSDNPRTEEPSAIISEIAAGLPPKPFADCCTITDRRDAIAFALKMARAGDVVVLAGKGHETYQIVGHEKRHFDEREVVAELLETIK